MRFKDITVSQRASVKEMRDWNTLGIQKFLKCGYESGPEFGEPLK
jgi:hypothetical protein